MRPVTPAKPAIFLDWNSGAPLHAKATEALFSFPTVPLNPSSNHSFGRRARSLWNESLEQIALSLGCSPQSVLVCSSGTEANQSAIQSALSSGMKRWILCGGDHDSSRVLIDLVRAKKIEVIELGLTRDGEILFDELMALLNQDIPTLVTGTWVNNLTGVIVSREKLEALGAMAASRGALIHIDAAQAWGKLEIEFDKLPIHSMTVTGHKIGGPAGIGFLVMKKPRGFVPSQPGSQQRKLRGGTENLLGLVMTAGAVQGIQLSAQTRLRQLRDGFEAKLLDKIKGTQIHSNKAPRVANTSYFWVGEGTRLGWVTELDQAGFGVSAGSACSAHLVQPTHVLKAMGCDDRIATTSIRVSIGSTTTEDMLDSLITTLQEIVQRNDSRLGGQAQF